MAEYNAPSQFSIVLKALRERAKLSQARLAHEVAVHTSLVSHWESGKRMPDAQTLGRVIAALKEAGVPESDTRELWGAFGRPLTESSIGNPVVGLIAAILGDDKLDDRERFELESRLTEIIDQHQRFARAAQHFSGRNWQLAYEGCQDILDRDEIAGQRSRVKPLVMQATCAYRLGQYHDAIDRYSAVLFILRDQDTNDLLPDIYIRLGSVYRRLGEWSLAEEQYGEAKKVYEKTGNQLGVAACLRSLAGNLLFQGEAEPALAHCNQALEIYHRHHNSSGENATLQHLGWALALSGDTESAIRFHREVFEQARQRLATGQPGSAGEGEVQVVKAARYYADSCLAHADLVDESATQTWLELAEQLYSEALGTINQFPGSDLERGRLLKGEILLGLGRVATRRQEWIKARELLQQSEQIHRELGEQVRLSMVLQAEGRLMAHFGNIRLAEERLEEAERIFRRLSNSYHRANVVADLARIRSRVPGREATAVADGERGLGIVGSAKYWLPKAWLHTARAVAQTAQEDFIGAGSSFLEAIKIAHLFSPLLVDRVLDEVSRVLSELRSRGNLEAARRLEQMLGSASSDGVPMAA